MKIVTDVPEGMSNGTQAVIDSLRNQLPMMIAHRTVLASKMEGVPRGVHVVGRLQRQFNLSSSSALLESIRRMYEIIHITAEVIESMEGVKMDKYQLDRTEILTYVSNVVQTMRTSTPDSGELELIGVLITSFEASQNSWVLQSQSGPNGLHVKFVELYNEIRDMNVGELPIFVPSQSAVQTMGSVSSSLGWSTEDLDRAGATYKLALVRVVDHVYSLLLETDVWAAFVAPRLKADVTTNLERAKTLRIFAHYLQSLLIYPQFFSLEMVLHGYEQIQAWIQYFPPLSAEIKHRLESVIRPHDVLGAGEDVKRFLTSFSEVGEKELKVTTLATELIGVYGLDDVIAIITTEINKLKLNVSIDRLIELDDKAYLPLLAGIPVTDINVGHKVAEAVLLSKKVESAVSNALGDLLPVIARGVTKDTLNQLVAMQIRPKIPFISPSAQLLEVTRGVKQEVSRNMLRIDRKAPVHSFDYYAYIRKNYKYAIAIDEEVFKNRPYREFTNIIDLDKAHDLQQILATSWPSLIPSFLAQGERYYDAAAIKASESDIRFIMERMGGSSLELIVKELTLPHRAKMWATFLSSFALLYYRDDAMAPISSEDSAEYQLIMGHGQPYGTSYINLEMAQPPLDVDKLIPLSSNFFLRMLETIPISLPELAYDQAFFGHHPVSYFASNSVSIPVSRFVWGEGLSNFCMTPIPATISNVGAKFGTRYVYSLRRMVLNYNIFYSAAVPAEARENFPLPVVEHSWNLERDTFFLRYLTFGHYAAGRTALEQAPPATLALIQQQMEEKEKSEEKAAAIQAEGMEQHIEGTERIISNLSITGDPKGKQAEKKKKADKSGDDDTVE